MYCTKCGTQIAETSRYCAECGHPVAGAAAVVETKRDPRDNSLTIMIMGIVSLAFSCTFFFSVGGLVFSIIGLTKAGNFEREFADAQNRKVIIGKRLALAGLIVSLVMVAVMIVLSIIKQFRFYIA